MIGDTLSSYEILEKLASGGMGDVFIARDTRLGRKVALKVLSDRWAADPEGRGRFDREARVLAALNHPNIVTIHSVEEAGGVHFLTMELLEGKTLDSCIPGGGFSLDTFLRLAIPLTEALGAAHESGVIHRDLKPSNIVVDDEGRPKILDFGVAKLREDAVARAHNETQTGPGSVLGTLSYMSPDQLKGQKIDHRTDLFSLGILLYKMATGKHPFSESAKSTDLVDAILNSQPCPPTELNSDLPVELDAIVGRCLAKSRRRRFQAASEVSGELRGLRRQLESDELTERTALTRLARRRPRRALAMAAVLLAALAASFFWWHSSGNAPAAMAAGDRPSLAVLYFDNLSGNSELEWLRRGLTEMLVTDLSQSPDLEVLSTGRLHYILEEVGALRDGAPSFETLHKIAARGHVQTVLVGSFAQVEGTLRIHANLQDTDGRILATYRRESLADGDLFTTVDELSAEIRMGFAKSAGKRATAAPELDRVLAEVTTSSLEAYRHYTEGLRLHNEFRESEAVSHFQEAVTLDPGFAMAWAKLAVIHSNLGLDQEIEGYTEQALAHLERLTARERAYIEGWNYRRRIETWDRAVAVYEEGLELYPDADPIRGNLGLIQYELERFDEARASFEYLVEHEDVFQATYRNLAMVYFGMGEVEKGRRLLENMTRRRPDSFFAHQILGGYLLAAGRDHEAREALDRAEQLTPGDLYTQIGIWEAAAWQDAWDEADDIARRIMTSKGRTHRLFGAYRLALSHLYHGRTQEGLATLREALRAYGQTDRTSAAVRVLLADLYLQLDEPQLALEESLRAQTEAHGGLTEWQGRHLEAVAETRLGRHDTARGTEARFRGQAAAGLGTVALRARHHLSGELAFHRGDAATAAAELERAAAMLPAGHLASFNLELARGKHIPIWWSLARAHVAAGRAADAAPRLEEIVTADTNRLYTPLRYVRSLYLRGRIHAAAGETEKARELHGRFAAYWRDGDIDHAQVAEALRLVTAGS